MPQVQPVNAGTAGSDVTVVVVDVGGTGPVSDNTNVSFAEPVREYPAATQLDTLTHDTDDSASSLATLGLDTIDHTVPSHTISKV